MEAHDETTVMWQKGDKYSGARAECALRHPPSATFCNVNLSCSYNRTDTHTCSSWLAGIINDITFVYHYPSNCRNAAHCGTRYDALPKLTTTNKCNHKLPLLKKSLVNCSIKTGNSFQLLKKPIFIIAAENKTRQNNTICRGRCKSNEMIAPFRTVYSSIAVHGYIFARYLWKMRYRKVVLCGQWERKTKLPNPYQPSRTRHKCDN